MTRTSITSMAGRRRRRLSREHKQASRRLLLESLEHRWLLSSIHGVKFEDLNANGVREEGEPGLAGWQITLEGTDATGAFSRTIPTDDDGRYWFSDLEAGDYSVTEKPQPGWLQSSPSEGGYEVTLDGQSIVENLDFGNYVPGSIHGIKFEDIDVDGVYDPTVDLPLEGVAITLSTNPTGPAVIIDNGDLDFVSGGFTPFGGQGFQNDVHYSAGNAGRTATWTFTGLTAGNYRVSTTWTPQLNRATNAPYSIDGGSAIVVNQELPPSPDVVVAGFSFQDLSASHTISGNTLTVKLTDIGANEFVIADAVRVEPVPQAQATITTDANGEFWFEGLRPGDYVVSESPPFGTFPTTPTSVELTVQSRQELVALPGQAHLPTVAFPLSGAQEVPPVETQASGECTGSLNAAQTEFTLLCTHDVADAVAAHIHDGPAGSNGPVIFNLGDPSSPINATWTGLTDENVDDLLAGNLYVNVHSPTNPGGEIRGQIPVDPRVEVVVGRELMFGNAFEGSIHGYKFEDLNFNGVRDPGEPGLGGVEIVLSWTDAAGVTTTSTTTTSDDGQWWFQWLRPGITYTVTEKPPAGSMQSTPNPQPITILSGQEYVATQQQGAEVQRAVTFPWWWEIELDPVPIDGQTEILMLEGLAEFGFSDLVDAQTGEVVPLVDPRTGQANDVPEGRDFIIQTEIVSMDLRGPDPVTGGEAILTGTGVGQGVIRNEGGFLTGGFDSNFNVDSFFDITYQIEIVTPDGESMVIAPTEPLAAGRNFTADDEIPPNDVRWMPTFIWQTGLGQDLLDEAGQLWDRVITIHAIPHVEVEKPVRPVVDPLLAFGNTYTGSIHGFKFEDLNADGVYDPRSRDVPLAKVPFELTGTDGMGNAVGPITVPTNEKGEFWFTGLKPGEYRVREIVELLPDSVMPSTPSSYQVTIASREEYVWRDGAAMLDADDPRFEVNVGSELMFGNFRKGSIHGLKYEDLNGNGVRDDGEPGLPDWEITLTGTDGMGNPVEETTITMADDPATSEDEAGMFWFVDLKPGTYRVGEVQQPGWVQSGPLSAVSGDVVADNYHRLYTGSAADGATAQGAVSAYPTVAPYSFSTTDQFLYIAAWGDDAIQQGLLAELSIDSNTVLSGDPSWQVLATGIDLDSTTPPTQAQIDAAVASSPWLAPAVGGPNNGTFPPGNPWPAFSAIDASAEWMWHDSGRQTTGSAPPFRGGFNHDEFLVFRRPLRPLTVHSGEELVATEGQAHLPAGTDKFETVVGGVLEIGNYAPGSIHGIKFEDVDVNGFYDPSIDLPMEGVAVSLSTDITAIVDDGDVGFDDGGFTPFGGQGFENDVHYSAGNAGLTATWTFTGLQPGVYQVSATWTPHVNRATNASFSIDAGTPILVNQQLPPAPDAVEAGFNFQNLSTSHTITGDTLTVKLTDLDANGFVIADAIRVKGGAQLETITTDANGEFWFEGLRPGDYVVSESPPFGTFPTTPTSVELTVQSRQELVALPGQAHLPTVAFPLSGAQEVPPVETQASGECTGSLNAAQTEFTVLCTHDVADAVAAHIHDGPAGSNGPVIFNLGDPSSPISATWTGLTDENVDDLLAGNLYVNVHSPANPAGEIRGQIPVDPRVEVVVGRELMFGNAFEGSIHGYKFEDLNFNGVRDPGEPGLGGVEIVLSWTDAAGVTTTSTTTTSDDGQWWFQWLRPGITYTVTEKPPAGSMQSTPNPQPITILSGQEYVATQQQGAEVQRAVTFPWWWEIELDPVPIDGQTEILMLEGLAEFGFSDLVDAQTGEVVPLVDPQTGRANDVPEGRDFIIQTEIVSMDLRGVDPVTGGEAILRGTGVGQGLIRNEGGFLIGGFAPTPAGVDSFFDVFYEIEIVTPDGESMVIAPTEPLAAGRNFTAEDEIAPNDVRWMPTFIWQTGLAQDLLDEAGQLWDRVITIHAIPHVEVEKPVRPVVDPRLAFGNTYTGSIHGFKFEDVDANGVYDPQAGDVPFSGVSFEVTGTDGMGNAVGPIVVPANDEGEFWFVDLKPGDYWVREQVELLPEVVMPSTPTEFHVTIASREEYVWRDGAAMLDADDPRFEVNVGRELMFGNFVKGSIHGFKFEDKNANGRLDQAHLLHGVEDDYAPGNPEPTTPSTGLSNFFAGLGIVPKGFDSMAANRHFGDSFLDLPEWITGAHLTIGLKPHLDIPSNDSITLGIYDDSDPAGSAIETWSARIGSGAPSSLLTDPWTQSQFPNGTVLWLDLANLPTAGGGSQSLLDALNTYGKLDVRIQDDTAVDFMELWVDSDFGPMGGVPFELTGTDGMGNAVGPIVQPTDDTGQFWFVGLKPGQYLVREMAELLPPNVMPSTQTEFHVTIQSREEYVWRDGAAMLDPDDLRHEVNVGSELIFGNFLKGSIHGRKFKDIDADGQHDPGEPYLNGWQVVLFDQAGDPVASTTTMDMDLDGDQQIDPETERGWYWFPDLPPGHYTVGEILPTDDHWLQTTPLAPHSDGVIEPGFDLFMTDAGTTFVDLEPVLGTPLTIQLEGVPFGPGGTDTIVQRLEGADLSSSAPSQQATVPIELVALQLQSVEPVDLGGELFTLDVFAGRDFGIPQQPGQMTIVREHEFGGSFTAQLPVQAQLVFNSLASSQVIEVFFEDLFLSESVWSTAPSAGDPRIVDEQLAEMRPAGGFFPGVDHQGICPGKKVLTQEQAMLAAHGVLPAMLRDAVAPGVHRVWLHSGEVFEDLDFGNTKKGSIHGYKFEDLNANGIDDFEPRLQGVVYTLTGIDGMGNPVGPLVTTTDQNGEFWFEKLKPGTYTVVETLPPGFMPSTPLEVTVTVLAGQEFVGADGQSRHIREHDTLRPQYVPGDGYLEFINPTEHPGLIGTVVPTSPPGLIWTEEFTGYTLANGVDVIETGDSDTTAGDRADFDWVQENRPVETTGGGNHGGMTGAMGWTVGTPETSPHIDPGTGLAHGHSDEEVPPGPLPHLDNDTYAEPFFAAVDVFSIISIGQDQATDAAGNFSPRDAALDYVVDFVNTVTGVFSPGVLTDVWVPGWTAATTIDDYVARWVPANGGVYDVVAIEPKFAPDFDEITEIDAIKALRHAKEEIVLPELAFGNFVKGSIHGFKFEDKNGNGQLDEVTLVQGIADDFVLPTEPTMPSPGLVAAFNANPNVVLREYDEVPDPTVNNVFADTFKDLPEWITSAHLHIQLKPHPGGSFNDTITLGVFDDNDPNGAALARWSAQIGSSSPSSLLPNPWTTSDYPDGALLWLDLADLDVTTGGSVLDALNTYGKLDVFTQDDTSVDFMELVVHSDFGPMPGIPFELTGTDGMGNPVGPIVQSTDDTGQFWFTGLKPGDYTVREMVELLPPDIMPSTDTDFQVTIQSREEYVWREGAAMLPAGDPRHEIVVGDELIFGNFRKGSIHGRKFEDLNANGIHDQGEPYLNGWTIELTDSAGNPAGSTVTMDMDLDGDGVIDPQNESGWYWFTDLPPDHYTVSEVLIDNRWMQTAPMAPGVHAVWLHSGEIVVDADFGNTVPGSIHGFKFEDVNADGVYDPQGGDRPFANIPFELTGTDGMGNPVGPITRPTNDEGEFWFVGLKPGEYRVREVVELLPDSVMPSTDTDFQVTIQSREEYAWREGAAMLEPDDPRREVVVGDKLMFGNFRKGSMHGLKYEDLNGNGVRDAGERGLADWEITLTGTDGMGNPVELTTITMADDPSTPEDEAGMFWFVDLKPGVYGVGEIQQPGWAQSGPISTISGDVVADNFHRLYTGSASNGATAQGAVSSYPSVAPYSFSTSDEFLYIAAWSDDAVQQGLLAELNIDSNTVFSGDPLWQVLATGIDLDSTTPPTQAQIDAAIASSPWVAPAVGGPNNGTFPPGNPWPAFSAIDASAEWMWHDSGRQTTGSAPPFRGGFNHDEFLVFRRPLRPLTVHSGEELVATQGQAELPADSDKFETVVGGVLEIGNFRPASIHGTKFSDVDADGVRDPNEPGIAGWTIRLDGTDGAGNPVSQETTTMADDPDTPNVDETGRYWLTDLAPGTYTVSEVQRPGWTQTAPAGPGTYQVTVQAGDIVTGADFGNHLECLAFDFNGSSNITAAGHVGVGTANVFTPLLGYGWASTAPTFDRGVPTALLRDGHYGTDNTFQVDILDGTYVVNVTVGDAFWPRNFIDVYAEGVQVLDNLATSPGQFIHRSFTTTVSDGRLDVRFANSGGDPFFVVNALKVWPSVRTHTLTGPVGTTISGSGATPGALITVAATGGTVAPPATDPGDKGPNYAGIQVRADATGAFSFEVTTSGGGAPVTVTSEEVNGGGRGTATFTPGIAAVRRFDFNGPSNDTQTGFTGVRAKELFNTTAGYGYTSVGSEFERGTASPASVSLYRDGHWGYRTSSNRTFQVSVATGTSYDVRAYMGDTIATRDRIQVSIEGGAFVGVSTPTSPNTFTTVTLLGISDQNADGILNIEFSDIGGSDSYWVINGLDIADSATGLPATAPLLIQTTASSRTSAEPLSLDAIHAVRAAAIDRWSASGLTSAQVDRIVSTEFRVEDLDASGALGLAGSRLVLIDDDAAGYGWHVSTSQNAFGTPVPAGRVDLLTVVMHELGHIAGYGDLDPVYSPNSMMTGVLTTGLRRTLFTIEDPVGLVSLGSTSGLHRSSTDLLFGDRAFWSKATRLHEALTGEDASRYDSVFQDLSADNFVQSERRSQRIHWDVGTQGNDETDVQHRIIRDLFAEIEAGKGWLQ